MRDPLYRNSIYVMGSNLIMAVLGFAFWIIIARLFPAHNVGIATALISMVSLLSNFSLLGFNVSLIRYLPKSTQKDEKINSSLLLVVLASLISSAVFIGGLPLFSPKLVFLQTDPLYIITFFIFVISISLSSLLDSIFTAYRSSGNILIKSFILSTLKLIFPLIFLIVGAYGIFASVALANLIGVFAGFVILLSKFGYKPSLSYNKDVVKKMASFSAGNYISGFFSQVPALVLPLLIINKLNAETAAYFYMDMMILSFLTIISGAATQSLLAEGSYDESKLKEHFLKATKVIFLFLMPAIILIVLFGNIILQAFGKDYASDAFLFLQLLSVSSIFISICSLGNAIFRVRQQIKYLIFVNLFGDILVLGLAYLFIDSGLVGVGIGWLLGRIILSLVYAILLRKDIFVNPHSFGRILKPRLY